MHSEWSDGSPTVREIADACLQRGYHYAAVTDHSYGLKIAGGMSMAEAAQQRRAIDDVNARHGNQFRLLQGIEANIDAAGHLDLSDAEATTFDVVLAAPRSQLRKDGSDQPHAGRNRAPGSQDPCSPAWPDDRIARGVIANWDAVFCLGSSARCRDRNRRDPARQDLDHTLASALLSGMFALDSDAHTTAQLSYAETALRTRAPVFPPKES
jgi:histidinol phosphatase-like PHP family hydrolase